MATDKDFVDYVAEQIGLGSRLSYRKMFGEYALYRGGKVVALIIFFLMVIVLIAVGSAA